MKAPRCRCCRGQWLDRPYIESVVLQELNRAASRREMEWWGWAEALDFETAARWALMGLSGVCLDCWRGFIGALAAVLLLRRAA